MFTLVLTFLFLTANLVLGHGFISDFYIDSVYYKGFSPYYDLPHANTPNTTNALPPRISYTLADNWPIYDVTSPNLTCNYNPIPGSASLVAPVKPGGNITMLYTSWPTNHFGPILTYMASCYGSCTAYTAYEAQWFKVAQDGLRGNGSWASDEFINNNSTWTLKVPGDLPPGEYIVRNELISLHAVEEYGAEIYPACFQIRIEGNQGVHSAEDLPRGVRIPGPEFYKANDTGLVYNVTTDAGEPYVFPGPPVYNEAEFVPLRLRRVKRSRRGM